VSSEFFIVAIQRMQLLHSGIDSLAIVQAQQLSIYLSN